MSDKSLIEKLEAKIEHRDALLTRALVFIQDDTHIPSIRNLIADIEALGSGGAVNRKAQAGGNRMVTPGVALPTRRSRAVSEEKTDENQG